MPKVMMCTYLSDQAIFASSFFLPKGVIPREKNKEKFNKMNLSLSELSLYRRIYCQQTEKRPHTTARLCAPWYLFKVMNEQNRYIIAAYFVTRLRGQVRIVGEGGKKKEKFIR